MSGVRERRGARGVWEGKYEGRWWGSRRGGGAGGGLETLEE